MEGGAKFKHSLEVTFFKTFYDAQIIFIVDYK